MLDAPAAADRIRRLVVDQPATLGDGDCEALRPGLVGQPVNTASSFAYLGAATWVAAGAPRRVGALAYGALLALTGVGSIAYHGPQFPGAQALHDTPIAGVAALGALVPLVRRARGETPLPGWTPRRGVAMGAVLAASAVAYRAGRTDSRCCRPRSLLQPHGLWHLGTATTLGLWGRAVWPGAT